VDGAALPVLDAIPARAALGVTEHRHLPASWSVWSQASKLALELVARQRFVPRVPAREPGTVRCAAILSAPADSSRVQALAAAMPLAAHAVPLPPPDGHRRRGRSALPEVWAPAALLAAFLDAAVDAMVRRAAATPAPIRVRPRTDDRREPRLLRALRSADPAFAPTGFPERTVRGGGGVAAVGESGGLVAGGVVGASAGGGVCGGGQAGAGVGRWRVSDGTEQRCRRRRGSEAGVTDPTARPTIPVPTVRSPAAGARSPA
jgi:hypothetical protein